MELARGAIERLEAPRLGRDLRVVASITSDVLLATGFVGGNLGVPVVLRSLLYSVAVEIGAYFFAHEAPEELLAEREIGIELFMTAAAVVAGLLGQRGESATLVFLYSIWEAPEGYTGDRACYTSRLRMDLASKTALLKRGQAEVRVPVGGAILSVFSLTTAIVAHEVSELLVIASDL